MPVSPTDLAPYKSFLLIRTAAKKYAGLVAIFLDEIRASINQSPSHSDFVSTPPTTQNSLEVGYVHYQRKARPSWLLTNELEDRTHELVVVLRKTRLFAIHTSDSSIRERIRHLIGTGNGNGLSKAFLISADTLNAAFVAGETQTLWLSGAHRRMAAKADNKVLSGMDLQYALDPLDDQTFFFTAARSRQLFGATPATIGVSPRKSMVWLTSSESWNNFKTAADRILSTIEGTTNGVENPLPTLATVGASGAGIANAYDACLIPPELLENATPEEDRTLAELWCNLRLEITQTNGANFSCNLHSPRNHQLLGTANLQIDFANTLRIRCTASGNPQSPQTADEHQQAIDIITGKAHWLKVWYESGHVIADRAILRLRYRDLPFTQYRWADFSTFTVTQEKPDPLLAANIGQQQSLFCWVFQRWYLTRAQGMQGWLACNDGSMEIADFIHLDNTGTQLTLIHVKGANSASNARRVAVSPYEIVVSQAVKNIRHVDTELLTNNFTQRLDHRITDAVWHNGAPTNRQLMQQALGQMTASCSKNVIVVQPHARQTQLNAARQAAIGTPGRSPKSA